MIENFSLTSTRSLLCIDAIREIHVFSIKSEMNIFCFCFFFFVFDCVSDVCRNAERNSIEIGL